jgi:hypothetical protein
VRNPKTKRCNANLDLLPKQKSICPPGYILNQKKGTCFNANNHITVKNQSRRCPEGYILNQKKGDCFKA